MARKSGTHRRRRRLMAIPTSFVRALHPDRAYAEAARIARQASRVATFPGVRRKGRRRR